MRIIIQRNGANIETLKDYSNIEKELKEWR